MTVSPGPPDWARQATAETAGHVRRSEGLEELQSAFEAVRQPGRPLDLRCRFSPREDHADFLPLGQLAIQADAQSVQAEIEQLRRNFVVVKAFGNDDRYFAFGAKARFIAALFNGGGTGNVSRRGCHGPKDYRRTTLPAIYQGNWRSLMDSGAPHLAYSDGA